MIMGAAASTVYYNLKLRHPTLDITIIVYDLALLFQPMLMLGISIGPIGVAFDVIFADWMVTVLLIVLFIGTSTKAFMRGVDTWKKETIMKKEAAKRLESNGSAGDDVEYKPLPSGPTKESADREIITTFSVVDNMREHLHAQKGKFSRKDDSKVEQLLDDIEKLRQEFESIERPNLQMVSRRGRRESKT